jgi:hypothetical protein
LTPSRRTAKSQQALHRRRPPACQSVAFGPSTCHAMLASFSSLARGLAVAEVAVASRSGSTLSLGLDGVLAMDNRPLRRAHPFVSHAPSSARAAPVSACVLMTGPDGRAFELSITQVGYCLDGAQMLMAQARWPPMSADVRQSQILTKQCGNSRSHRRTSVPLSDCWLPSTSSIRTAVSTVAQTAGSHTLRRGVVLEPSGVSNSISGRGHCHQLRLGAEGCCSQTPTGTSANSSAVPCQMQAADMSPRLGPNGFQTARLLTWRLPPATATCNATAASCQSTSAAVMGSTSQHVDGGVPNSRE